MHASELSGAAGDELVEAPECGVRVARVGERVDGVAQVPRGVVIAYTGSRG